LNPPKEVRGAPPAITHNTGGNQRKCTAGLKKREKKKHKILHKKSETVKKGTNQARPSNAGVHGQTKRPENKVKREGTLRKGEKKLQPEDTRPKGH